MLDVLIRLAELQDEFGGEGAAWSAWRFGGSSTRHFGLQGHKDDGRVTANLDGDIFALNVIRGKGTDSKDSEVCDQEERNDEVLGS